MGYLTRYCYLLVSVPNVNKYTDIQSAVNLNHNLYVLDIISAQVE